MNRVRPTLIVAALAAVVATSCSYQGPVQPLPETGASLEGALTYGGQKVPLAAITVALDAPGGGSVTGFADDDGNFKIDNVPVGAVKIAVDSDAAKGPMMGRAMAGTNPNVKGGKRAAPPKVVDVPKKYAKTDTSGLTTTVAKGVNRFDITIAK